MQISCASIDVVLKRLNTQSLTNGGGANIFVIDCELFLGNISVLKQFLTTVEIDQISVVRNKKEQQYKLIGKAIRKWILSRYLNSRPQDIVFEKEIFGKPFCKKAAANNIFFNSADSDRYLVFSCANKPVGIDIELIDLNFGYDEIVAAHFTKYEQIELSKHAQKTTLFYTYWTRKEAVLKVGGKGLLEELSAIQVIEGINKNNQRLDKAVNSYTVISFMILKNFIVSIAFPEPAEQLTFYSILPEDII